MRSVVLLSLLSILILFGSVPARADAPPAPAPQPEDEGESALASSSVTPRFVST